MKKLAISLIAISCASTLFGQGSLTPPGAPAPTMKTLDQVEARIPLVSASPGVSVGLTGTITISQSGSYYLTQNWTVSPFTIPHGGGTTSAGNGITINADGVTVDLNGFTISSTEPTAAGTGIEVDGSSVSIFNGHIVSGTVYDSGAGGDQYTGFGFEHGIYSSDSYTSIRIREVCISGCDQNGIYLANYDSLVEFCTVKTVGGTGINAGVVKTCSATICGYTGIYGALVTDCRADSTGSDGIGANTVANSCGYTISTDTTAAGIYAGNTVQNSYGYSEGGDGIHSEGTVANSYGKATSTDADADGIYATVVQNSYGESAGGNGISSQSTVDSSYGFASSTNGTSANGIFAWNTVQNSHGTAWGGHRNQVVRYGR